MRMKGGIRRFQTGGANPQAIQNPGMAAVMNSPQMQANLAAARSPNQPTSATSGWVSPSAPPGSGGQATPAQIAAAQASDAQFARVNPSAAAMFGIGPGGVSSNPNSGVTPGGGAPGGMPPQRPGPTGGPPTGGGQTGAFTAGAPANGLGSAPGLNPQAIQQALQQRRSIVGGPPAPGGPAGAPAAGWPGQGGMPPQVPPGGGMPPPQAGGGMPGGMPPQGPQPNPQMIAAMMAARQQQPGAAPAPGMAEGGAVKQDGDTVAKKRRPAPQWGASKAAEDIPTVEKKARGGAIKRRKPPVARKPKLPPPPVPSGDEGPDIPPPSAGPAVGPPALGAPGMKKGGKWIQDMHMKEGALHKDLGVPEDKKIPKKKLNAAAKKGGKVGKRARVAKTLGKFNKGGKCDKMAAGGAMKVRRGFPNTLKAPKKLAAGGAVRLAKGGKVRGCGAATKGCSFSGIY